MIIYGEYLFLENMLVGMVTMHFTAKLSGESLKWYRLWFCGLCCGLYAFILFTDFSGILSLFGKLLFSIAMAAAAFGKRSLQRILKSGFLFFSVTILFGGLAIAVLTSFGRVGVTAVSGVYLPPVTYMAIMIAAAVSAWVLWLLVKLVRGSRMEQQILATAKVSVGGSTWFMRGLIDSGNRLKAPLTGKAVCIVRRELLDTMLPSMEDAEQRYTVIPYHAVGVEHGMLEGYRMDEIYVEGAVERRLLSPVLAACEEESFFRDGNDLEILLPGMLLEGGIYGDH